MRDWRYGRRGAARVVMVLALGGVLLGCEDRRIDLHNLEAAISHRYGRDAPVAIEAVECPEWVRTRVGERFECVVRFDGGVRWTIELIQEEGGGLQWAPRGQVVYADILVSWLRQALAARGQTGEPQCGARVYVIAPGEAITCELTGGAAAARVTVDEVGSLRLMDSGPGAVPVPEPAPAPATDGAQTQAGSGSGAR
ncbi:DUF4333 domain-containing protein [Haliangium sp.]|uniref:DUF4333 domain-containing protein n=1 Tax=Haliangium sp. TaxID=2663208 RepID=UPI003D123D08